MKDSLLLLLSAGAAASAAWAFWHFLGRDALEVLTTVAVVALAVDNTRLRRLLRNSR